MATTEHQDSNCLLDEYEFLKKLVSETVRGRGIVPILGAGISVASGIPAIPQIQAYLKNCILLAIRNGWTPEFGWPSLNYFNKNPQAELGLAELKEPKAIMGFGAIADWRKGLDFISRLTEKPELGPPNSGVIDSFFQHVTSSKQPNLSHRMIVNLAAIGKIDLVLTTNFDELIENAIDELSSIQYSKIVLHHNTELPPYSTFESRAHHLTLLKLHGDRYGLRADDSLDLPASAAEKEHFANYFFRFKEFERPQTSANLLLAGISLSETRLHSLIQQLRRSGGPNIYICCYSKSDLANAIHFQNKVAPIGDSNSDLPKINIMQSRDFGLTMLRFYQMLTNSIPPQGVVTSNQVNVPWPIIYEYDWKRSNAAARDSRAQKDQRIFDMGEVISATTLAEKSEVDRVFRQCRDRLNQSLDAMSASKKATILSVFGTSQYQGLSALFSTVFYDRVDRWENCIWFDLDTAGDVDDFYEKLLECIVKRTATQKWWTPKTDWNNEERVSRLADHLNESSSRWTIVINIREGAGTNGPKTYPPQKPSEQDNENGWLDELKKDQPNQKGQKRDSRNVNEFISLIDHVSKIRSEVNANFVFLAHKFKHGSESATEENSPFFDRVKARSTAMFELKVDTSPQSFVGIKEQQNDLNGSEEKGREPKWPSSETIVIESTTNLGGSDEPNNSISHATGSDIIEQVYQWIIGGGESKEAQKLEESKRAQRLQFLLALLLMRKPRHLVVPSGWAFRNETNKDSIIDLWENSESVEDNLKQLSQAGLVFLKPGGFIWLNSHARDRLRDLMSLKKTKPKEESSGKETKSKKEPSVDENIQSNFEEKLEDYLQEYSPFDKSIEPTPESLAMFWKARTHRAISRIYRRELQVTGEAISAIDATHHYFESASEQLQFWNKLEKNWPNRDDQLTQAIHAINDARILLREYEEQIVHQGIANCKCRRFSWILEKSNHLLEEILEGKEKTSAFNDLADFLRAMNRFQRSIISVMGKIAQETGFIQKAFVRQRQLRWCQYLAEKLEPQEKLNQANYQKHMKGILELGYSKQIEQGPEESEAKEKLQAGHRAENDRKFATLLIAARSYSHAQRKILMSLDAIEEQSTEIPTSSGKSTSVLKSIKSLKELTIIAVERFKDFNPSSKSLQSEQLIKLAARQMQLSTLVAKFCNYMTEAELSFPKVKRKVSLQSELEVLNESAIKAGCSAYWAGVTSIEQSGGNGSPCSSSSLLLSEMQKLETYSASIKRLEGLRSNFYSDQSSKDHDLESRFYNGSIRSLDNAEAWLDTSDDAIPKAIILLERAALVLDFVSMNVFRKSKNQRQKVFNPADLANGILVAIHDGKNKILDESSGNEILDLLPEIVRDWKKDSNHSLIEKESNNVLDKVETAAQLIASARKLIEYKKQSIWWSGYADQLALQAERLRLSFFLLEGKIPRRLLAKINQEWPTDFESHMTRLHARVFMDGMRYARCLHLFCDCSLFVLALRSHDNKTTAFNKKIQVLFSRISEYKSYLLKIKKDKNRLEGIADSERKDEVTPIYFDKIDERCELTLSILAKTIHKHWIRSQND